MSKYSDVVTHLHRDLTLIGRVTMMKSLLYCVLMNAWSWVTSQSFRQTTSLPLHIIKKITLYGDLKHTLGLVEVHLKLGAVYVQQSSHDLAKNEFESALQMAIDHNLYMLPMMLIWSSAGIATQGCYQESYRIVKPPFIWIYRI